MGKDHAHVVLEGETVLELNVERNSGLVKLSYIGPRASKLGESGDVRIFKDAASKLVRGVDDFNKRRFFTQFFDQLRERFPNFPSYPSFGVDIRV